VNDSETKNKGAEEIAKHPISNMVHDGHDQRGQNEVALEANRARREIPAVDNVPQKRREQEFVNVVDRGYRPLDLGHLYEPI